MKSLVIAIGLLISINGFCQKYTIGLVRNGTKVNAVEGLVVVTDSTVVSTFDGKSSSEKITSRKGYVIHVTDGTMVHKYVISLKAGRLHGFTYDHAITYELDKRHSKNPPAVYLCVIKRD
jgi:hypothetical protein